MKSIASYFKRTGSDQSTPKPPSKKHKRNPEAESGDGEFVTPSQRKSARVAKRAGADDAPSSLPKLQEEASSSTTPIQNNENRAPTLQRAMTEPLGENGGKTAKAKRAESDIALSEKQRSNIDQKKKEALKKLKARKLAAKNPFKDLASMVPESWRETLKDEFSRPYFRYLSDSLTKEYTSGKKIFPPAHQIFRAFELCPIEKIRVVIIGQDPYHGVGQAEGLCFSVPRGIKIPSSLRNIYKELKADIPKFRIPYHGNLIKWAEQGVFLLNTGLTVRAHQANSHKRFGWQEFTAAVVSKLNERKGLVFVLWGGHAQKKAANLTKGRHKIIKSVHPSGLSAHRGFFGSKPFSQVNEYLVSKGQEPIKWQV